MHNEALQQTRDKCVLIVDLVLSAPLTRSLGTGVTYMTLSDEQIEFLAQHSDGLVAQVPAEAKRLRAAAGALAHY